MVPQKWGVVVQPDQGGGDALGSLGSAVQQHWVMLQETANPAAALQIRPPIGPGLSADNVMTAWPHNLLLLGAPTLSMEIADWQGSDESLLQGVCCCADFAGKRKDRIGA